MYAVKKLSNSEFEVTNMKDDPITYSINKNTRGNYSCDCRGFYNQKDKTQHKHCLMVQALEELEEFDSMVLDADWKVVEAYSIDDAFSEIKSFFDEVITE